MFDGSRGAQGHRNAILKIVERPDDDLASVSYLHWAQAIALADDALDLASSPTGFIAPMPIWMTAES